jgi:hypothetical protein
VFYEIISSIINYKVAIKFISDTIKLIRSVYKLYFVLLKNPILIKIKLLNFLNEHDIRLVILIVIRLQIFIMIYHMIQFK